MMQGNSNHLGMATSESNLSMAHSSTDMRMYPDMLNITTKQEKDIGSTDFHTEVVHSRKGKSRSSNSNRSDGGKSDEKALLVHTQIQEMFASHLSSLLNDTAALELQCCMTYGKPCGCIRKFILSGAQWKENPTLRITSMKDKDQNTIAANDRATVQESELHRARELLDIFHHASELKKEKCYITSEGNDGKQTKELRGMRGMIGLGNGRKRSKKYEDFVLDRRELLREQYSLCEKAAQKLLGYSINFLYKKLRTNPQKTSRLVATNKAERAAKGPRHLIPLQQLQDMANNQQNANQCCCRNCIHWLVKQHFDKIVSWRHRLEGSGQRVAQQIVAEVLLVSASLDGQNSFCQNLVHWVTGCSFKKIRRVRDHLKKDPKSLPEHGLKKYWKEKGKKQTKARGDEFGKNLAVKAEKDTFLGNQDSFPMQYDARSSSAINDVNNLNNSNNRYDGDAQFIPSTSPNPPPNRTLPMGGMFSGGIPPDRRNPSSESIHPYQQQMQGFVMQGHGPNQQFYLPQGGAQASNVAPDMNSIAPAYLQHNSEIANRGVQVAGHFPNEGPAYDQANQSRFKDAGLVPARRDASTTASGRPSHEAEPSQYHEPQRQAGPMQKDDQGKFHSGPFFAGIPDMNANFDNSQAYYLAANPGNSRQDGLFHTGMTPLFLAQAQQVDPNNADQDAAPQFGGQQLFLLSPALPNHPDKNGGEFDSFKPSMMMPITPIPMYHASYFPGGMQADAGEGKTQMWDSEAPQHFVFSAPDGTMTGGTSQDQESNYPVNQQPSESDASKKAQPFVQANQQQAYFQPALTPLAVMPSQANNFFSGWLAATQPPMPPMQQTSVSSDQSIEATQQYSSLSDADRTKYVEASAVQAQSNYPSKSDHFYKVENPPLSTMTLAPWLPAQVNNGVDANQWMTPSSTMTPLSENQLAPQSLPTSNAKAAHMPPLVAVEKLQQNEAEKSQQRVPDVQGTSSTKRASDVSDRGSPKPASVANRSKRFSRDRLAASVDSPGLPPMTPLTPSLTPSILAGISAAANVEQSTSSKTAEGSESEQLPEGSVFRFPPTHISRRLAALRVEGVPIADSAEDGKSGSQTNSKRAAMEQDGAGKASEQKAGDGAKAESVSSESSKSQSGPNSNASTPLRYSGAAVNADGSAILVGYSNIRSLPVPVLSLPTCWPDDGAEVKPTLQNQSDQLRTPTPKLTTPTCQSNSSSMHLSTPTHQLHTPNQTSNISPHPLNTPTHALNTPTDVISPGSTSVLTSGDGKLSPVKTLLPVPVGKKRKPEADSDGPSPKSLRSHNFAPVSFNTEKASEPETFRIATAEEKRETRQKSVEAEKCAETIEIADSSDSDDNSSSRKASNEVGAKLSTSHSISSSSGSGKPTPSVKMVPSMFSLPMSYADNTSTPQTSLTQLNTPILVPSSAFLRPGSGSDRGSSSTPPYFTFLPGSGITTPVFLAPLDQLDHKSKLKPKSTEGSTSEGNAEKVKSSPLKRAHMSLSIIGKTHSEDGLQTPSKIPVVTPSAVLSAGLAPEMQQVFFPQEALQQQFKMTHSSDKTRADDSNQKTNDDVSARRANQDAGDEDKSGRRLSGAKKFRPPSLVVDPPSDTEEEPSKKTPPRKSPSREKPNKSPSFNSSSSMKPTLHRTRSGGKKDLVLSLAGVGSSEGDSSNDHVNSPLNTPSALQVITPTMAAVLPASKLTSPIQRYNPGMRMRPQPLMMAPVCLTSGANSSQIATPPFFHIVSPSQAAPPSPSVLVYPYPVRGSGPLSTGSIASPAFGIFQKAPGPSGSNSASLLKSALMKKWPVFQFPPPTRAPTPTSDSTSIEKEPDSSLKEQSKSPINQSETPVSSRDSTSAESQPIKSHSSIEDESKASN